MAMKRDREDNGGSDNQLKPKQSTFQFQEITITVDGKDEVKQSIASIQPLDGMFISEIKVTNFDGVGGLNFSFNNSNIFSNLSIFKMIGSSLDKGGFIALFKQLCCIRFLDEVSIMYCEQNNNRYFQVVENGFDNDSMEQLANLFVLKPNLKSFEFTNNNVIQGALDAFFILIRNSDKVYSIERFNVSYITGDEISHTNLFPVLIKCQQLKYLNLSFASKIPYLDTDLVFFSHIINQLKHLEDLTIVNVIDFPNWEAKENWVDAIQSSNPNLNLFLPSMTLFH
jgi:hypothetical protein